jgi:hypothetical protein
MLACVTGALGAAAVAQGSAQPLPLAPQWQDLGSGLAGTAEVAGILAVLLACYVGHQNLHPLLPLLKPYTGAFLLVGAGVGLVGCCQFFG